VSERVVEAGAGVRLDKWHLEVSDVSRHVLNLVRNSTYRHQAKRLGAILRAAGGTHMAADIIQDAWLRYKLRLLPQPAQLACWHQVYQLDLLALLLALVILVLLVLRAAVMLTKAALVALARKMEAIAAEKPQLTTEGSTDAPSAAQTMPEWRRMLQTVVRWQRAAGLLDASAPSAGGSADAQLNSHGSQNIRPVFPASTDGASLLSSRPVTAAALSAAGGRDRSMSVDSMDSQHSLSSMTSSDDSGEEKTAPASNGKHKTR